MKPTIRSEDVDRHVGARIRVRRMMLGVTQREFAALLGVTYQQAYKYERGHNRISAGRLFEIARVLGVPVTFFFEGLGEESHHEIGAHERMRVELLRDFAQIP